jgi:hypothetical protein
MTFAFPLTGAARYSMPRPFSIALSSAEPSSEMEEHSTTMPGAVFPESALASTSFTSS